MSRAALGGDGTAPAGAFAGVQRRDSLDSTTFAGTPEDLIAAGIIAPHMVPPPTRTLTFKNGVLTSGGRAYSKRDEQWLSVSGVESRRKPRGTNKAHLLVRRWLSQTERLEGAVRVAVERLGAPNAAEVGRHVSRVFAAGQDQAFQAWLQQTVHEWTAPASTPAPRGKQ